MSADRLREAAAKLRGLAGAATPGPWDSSAKSGIRVTAQHPDIKNAGRVVAKTDDDWMDCVGDCVSNAAFIAVMDPVVALAVADWLAKYADLVDATRHIRRPAFGDLAHALAVAEAVLA